MTTRQKASTNAVPSDVLSDGALDVYLSEIVHELRNLVYSFALTLQVAEQSTGKDIIGHAKSRVQSDGDAIVRLVENLRELSQLARGRFKNLSETTDVVDAVVEAVETVRAIAEPRDIDVAYRIETVSFATSFGRRRFTRILTTILSEMVRRCSRGEQIKVEVQRVGDQAEIRCTAPFLGRVDGAATAIFAWPRPPYTTGETLQHRLQLPLAHTLIRCHSGDVAIEGGELTITLPIQTPGRPAMITSDGSTGPSRHVLVVDDNVDFARTIATFLRLSGHHAEIRHDGQQALAAAESLRPSVMVLDLGLPKLDGYQVAKTLRDQARFRDAMLIAVSGYGHDEARQRSRQVGFDHHLVKPIDNNELLSLIEQALSGR